MPENIDMMYQMVSNIYFLANQFIAAICLIFLCRDFIKKKRGTGLIGSAYFFVIVFLYYVPFLIDGFVAYLLALVAAFAVFVWLGRKNIKIKIFLFATFFVIRWIVFSISDSIKRLLYLAVLNLARSFYDLSDPAMWRFNFIVHILSAVLGIGLYGVILYLLIRVINKVLLYKQEDLELRELLFMLIPSVNGVIVYGIFIIYVTFYEEKMGLSFFQPDLPLQFFQILCYAVVLAVIVSTIILYQNIRKKREEESARFMLESQMRDMQTHISEVENSFDGRLEIDEESGFPKTKKSDKKMHGFGLQNIKSVAEKYYGDVLIEQKENRVSLTVMLLSAV